MKMYMLTDGKATAQKPITLDIIILRLAGRKTAGIAAAEITMTLVSCVVKKSTILLTIFKTTVSNLLSEVLLSSRFSKADK